MYSLSAYVFLIILHCLSDQFFTVNLRIGSGSLIFPCKFKWCTNSYSLDDKSEIKFVLFDVEILSSIIIEDLSQT